MPAKKKNPLKDSDRSGTKPMLLSELIQAVKLDLVESAKTRPANDSPLFWISEATVGTEVIAERKVGAEGKMDMYLVCVGADAQQSNATKHTVQVKLTSITQDGVLNKDSPLIRGVKRKGKKS